MEYVSSRRTKNRKNIFFGVALAFSFILGVWARNLIPVAIVDGQFVKRSQFTGLLVERAGRDVMQRIVISKFVNDEAKRRKIKVSKAEIQEQLDIIQKKLKSENATFEQYLTVQNLTLDQLTEELDLQLKVKKIFGPGLLVTTKEIDTYLLQNRIVKGKGAIYESQKVDVYDAIYKQKIQNEFRKFIADRLKKAKIHYFIKL